jgi:cystathionine beta-lyase
VFKRGFTREQVVRFVDSLELFGIGYSWGGVASLAMAYDFGAVKTRRPDYGHRIVRLNVGLEEIENLRADVERALSNMR